MFPTSDDCDECTPQRPLHPTAILFSSLPFIATFAVVATVVLQRVFPLLSGDARNPKENSNASLRPLAASRPTVKRISAIVFSSTFASAAVLTELILCEISNTISPAARSPAIRITVALLLFLLIIAIPFLEIHSVLSSAGYFNSNGSSSSRLAWILQTLSFAAWLTWFWWVGGFLLGRNQQNIGPTAALPSNLLETTSEKIGVIGISVMALLSGFASVSSPWQNFFTKPKPVTETTVARKAAGLAASQDLLEVKRARLRALERKLSDAPTESFFQKAVTSIRGNADLNERSTLLLEISGLETMSVSLSTSLSTLQSRLAQQQRARTPQGRFLLSLTYGFSLFCLYRILTTTLTFLRRLLSSRHLTATTFTTSDPVDNILALLTKHYNPKLDQATYARLISFFLSFIILSASFSSVMQTFLLFSRFAPSLLKTIQANLALVVAQVCATYVISAALMLRVMMPTDLVGEGLKSLGGGGRDAVAWIDGWFERWFWGGAVLTCLGIWIGKTLGEGPDWDDEFDDGGGALEMGKMS